MANRRLSLDATDLTRRSVHGYLGGILGPGFGAYGPKHWPIGSAEADYGPRALLSELYGFNNWGLVY